MKIETLKSSLTVYEDEIKGKEKETLQQAQQSQQDYLYMRTLVIRYMELESQHEALFPALATCFKLTESEVRRIQTAQQSYEAENSIWGRTVSAGSFLFGAAAEAVEAARAHGAAPDSGGSSTASASGRPR
uniref:GRIP domain-containing protein n=1 Tax=Haptolina ericina TaxID=156174 RepID=A0A7S3BSM7_9EUKA